MKGKHPTHWILLLLCSCLLHVESIGRQPSQALIPSGVSDAKLSPDGRYVAMIRRDADNLNALLIIRCSDRVANSYYPRDYRKAKRSVIDFAWATNDTVILTSDATANARSLHLWSEGERTINTIAVEGYWSIVDPMPQSVDYVVSRRSALWEQGTVEVQRRNLENPEAITVLYSCETRDFQCLTDSEHELRLIQRNPGENQAAAWFWKDGDKWKQSTLPGWTPVLSIEYGNPQSAFVAGWFEGSVPTVSLYDFKENRHTQKLLEHPDFAIDRYVHALRNAHPNALMGLRLDTAVPKDVWLTPKLSQHQTKVDEALPGTLNQILSWDTPMRSLVVKRTLLDSPPHYVWFDTTTGESQLLLIDGGDIREVGMGRSTVVQVTTADDTHLPAFLTMPPISPPRNLPLVVLLESDVISDLSRFQWNPVSAYLATQGFVVLRMNFRASPGLLGGVTNPWSSIEGVMTLFEDIDHGIEELIAAGLVDPNRVAIAGSGPGASLAAAAPAHCKSRFRAVVALNGVFDLMSYRESYHQDNSLKDIVALPFAAPESGLSDSELRRLSPMEQLANYPDALFLSSGKWSPHALKEQSSRFRSVASKNKTRVRLFEADWWGTNMPPAAFLRAWQDASKLLVESTK